MSTNLSPPNELARFYALFPVPHLAQDLFNVVEGYRVDSRLRSAYPGLARDMSPIRAATLERRPALTDLPEIPGIVEALVQHALGATVALDALPPAARDTAQVAIDLLTHVDRDDASVADAADTTARLYELLDDHVTRRREQSQSDESPSPGRDPSSPDDPDGDSGERPEAIAEYQQVEMPPFMTPVLEELMRRPDLPQSDRAGERPEGSEEPEDRKAASEADNTMQGSQVMEEGSADGDAQRSESANQDEDSPGVASDTEAPEESLGGGETPEGAVAPVPIPGEEPEEDLGEQVFYYDEWDHRIEDYRPGWCTLREQRSSRTQESFVAATFYEFGGIVTQIRRNFQLMRPERLRKMRFQSEGDDLDLDGIVEHVVDRRARVAPTERVYIKRDKKDRDVTTVFLVDMSSSTDRKIDDRKRILDVEKESLLLMCEALEAIRDEYAIYGFSGNGRDDCQFYVVKELGERYDDRVKGRIGGIYARQKTRMGPALRHATKRLASVDSNVKLLILVTDGKPYDSDTYQDNTYAQEDTKMALREARREKIHLFCVTVDKEGADYLPHMYSDANFVIIDDVRTLPQKLPQLYRRLTT